MAAPAFAILRQGEQVIHNSGKGVRVLVGKESIHHRGIALHRHRDAEDRERRLVALKELEDAPDAGARAVLVERFHRHVPHALERLGADDLGQERFRRLVAVQDRVLAAFLVIEHELQREARAARPFRLRRARPIAREVTRVAQSPR